MRRRRAVSNSPASLLRRCGSSTVARFVLIRSLPGAPDFFLSAVFFGSSLFFSGLRRPLPHFLGRRSGNCNSELDACSAQTVARPSRLRNKQAVGHALSQSGSHINVHIRRDLAPSPPCFEPPILIPCRCKEQTFAASGKEHAP